MVLIYPMLVVVQFTGISGKLSNCIFTNNSFNIIGINLTEPSGGAVYWYGADGIITKSSFSTSISYNGGAIYWYGANGSLTDCNFTNNIVTNYHGGAILWNGVNGIVSGSSFINNTANQFAGGAVFWGVDADNGKLTNCIFTNNTAHQ